MFKRLQIWHLDRTMDHWMGEQKAALYQGTQEGRDRAVLIGKLLVRDCLKLAMLQGTLPGPKSPICEVIHTQSTVTAMLFGSVNGFSSRNQAWLVAGIAACGAAGAWLARLV